MTIHHPSTTDHGTPARRSRAPRLAALAALAAAVAATALLPACADDDPAAAGAAADGTAPTTAPTQDPDDHSGHELVDVHAVDFAFEGLPDRLAAGTRLQLTNDAPAELHELVAFRLPDDEDRSVEELLALPEAELGTVLAGPPRTVLLAEPGGDQIPAVGDGTLEEPGRYLIMCAIPVGADPAEYLAAAAASDGAPPQVPGGPPHFVQGMAAELLVE